MAGKPCGSRIKVLKAPPVKRQLKLSIKDTLLPPSQSLKRCRTDPKAKPFQGHSKGFACGIFLGSIQNIIELERGQAVETARQELLLK